MATPYRVTGTPKIPNVPHPTPASVADGTTYVLPKPKIPRPPIRNPYDMFSQDDFDAWIGGITGALRQALGEEITTTQTKSSSIVDTHGPIEFKKGHTQFDETYSDTASDPDSEGLIEDSFAEVKARKLQRLAKGKARDPREGPGLGPGDKQNPIDIDELSDEEENYPHQRAQSEEDLEEELELESQLIPNDWEDEEEGSDDDHAIYPWQADRTSTAVTSHVRDESIERGASAEPDEGEEGDDFDESDGHEDARFSPIEVIDSDEDLGEEREGAADSDSGLEDQDEGYEEYSDQEPGSHVKPQITTARSAGLQQQQSSDEYSEEEEDELDEEQHGVGAASFQHEVIDVDSGDDDPAQPLAEDTSFPPVPHQGRPVDLPDRWQGPRTYAQDYYAGGDIRSQSRRPLNADYLGPDDEVAGFLTPDVVTPVVQSQELSDVDEGDEEAEEMYGEHEEFEDEDEDEEYDDATPPPHTQPQHLVRTQPEVFTVEDDFEEVQPGKPESRPDDEELVEAQSSPAGAINIEIDEEASIYRDGLGNEVDEHTEDIDIQIQPPSPYPLVRTPSPEDAFSFERKYDAIPEEVDNDTSTADNTPILTAQVDWSVTDTLPDGTRRMVGASATAEQLHTGVYHHPPAIPHTISDSSLETTPTTTAPSLFSPTPFELSGVIPPPVQPIPIDELLTALEPVPPPQDVDVEQPEDAHPADGLSESSLAEGDDDQPAQPAFPAPETPVHPQHYDFTALPTPPSEKGYSADERSVPVEALVQQSLDDFASMDEVEEAGVESATGSQMQIHEAEEQLEETLGQSERDQQVQQELVEEEIAVVGEQVVEVSDRADETMGVTETLPSGQVEPEPKMQVDDRPIHKEEGKEESERMVESPPRHPVEDATEVAAPEPLDEAKNIPSIRVDVSPRYLVSEVVTPILDEDEITDEDAYGEIDMELEIESMYEISSTHGTVMRDPVVEEAMTEGRLTMEPSDRGTSIAIVSLNASAVNTPTFERSTFLPETDEDVLVPSAQTEDEQVDGEVKIGAGGRSATPQESMTIQPPANARQGSLPGGIPMPISADPTVPDPTSRSHSSLALNRSPEVEGEIPGLSRNASTSHNVDKSDLATEGADPEQPELSPLHASTSSQPVLLPPTVMRALNLQRTGTSSTFNGLFTPVVGGSSGDVTPVTPVSATGEPDRGDQGAAEKQEEGVAITDAEAPVKDVGESGDYDDDSIASSSPSVNNDDPLPPGSPEDDIYFAGPADGKGDSMPMDENAITVESTESTEIGLRQESTLFIENEVAESTLTSLEEDKAQVVREEELLEESLVAMSDPDAIPGLGSFSSFNSARSSPHSAQATQFTSPSSLPFRSPSGLSRHASTPKSTLATTSYIAAPFTSLPVTMIPRKSTDPILYADPYPYSLSTPGVDHSKDEGYEEDMDLEGSSSSAEDDDSIPSGRQPSRKAAPAVAQNESNDDLDLLYPSDTEFQLYGPSALDNTQDAKAQATTKAEATEVTQAADEPADTATVEHAEESDTKDLLGFEDAHGDKDADGDVDPDFIAVAEQPPVVMPASEQEHAKGPEPPKPAIDPKTETDPFKLMGNDSVVSPHLEDMIVKEPSSSEESSEKEAQVEESKETTPKPDEAAKPEPQTNEPVSQEPSQAPEPPAPTSAEVEVPSLEKEEEDDEEEGDKSSTEEDEPEPAPSRPQKRKRATSSPVVPARHSRSAASRKASQIPRYKGKAPATSKTTTVPRTRKIKPIIKRKESAKQSRARGQSVESSSSGASVASRLLKPTSRSSSVASSAPSDRQKTPTANAFRPQIPPPLFHAHGRGRHQHILPMPPPQPQPVPEVPRAPAPTHVEPEPSTSAETPGELAPKPSSSSDNVPTQSEPPATENLPEPTTVTPSPQPPPPSTSQRPHATASSTPVTRSHCRYHRISIPKTEDGPRVFFLVPGCSLGDDELIEEEEIEDHGDATHEDTLKIVSDIETLDFEDYLFGVLRQLCGPDLLQKQEVFYLRQPGEQIIRKPRPKKSAPERLSHARQSISASTAHTGATSPSKNLSSLIRSPSSSRAPHSIAGSASSRRRHEGDDLSISDLGSDLTEEDDDDDDDGDSDTEPKHAKRQKVTSPDLSASQVQGSGSQPSISARTRRGKVKRLGPDAMAYKPQSETEVESGAEGSPRRRKRRGTKRSRTDGAPEEGEGSRRTKRIRTRPVATERP